MRTKNIFLVTLLLSGCSSATYKQDGLNETSYKLEKSSLIYILTPKNGRYESKQYSESGRTTAEAINSSFAEYSSQTKIINGCSELSCAPHPLESKSTYYVVPEILHWEDRATEWSMIPDKIKVKITVYNKNHTEVSSNIFSGKSKIWTFGGDHPEDLLENPVSKYVKSLYQ